ncbi:MAG: hypothetical protein AAGA21_09450 [Pseudomonadota bacterium]
MSKMESSSRNRTVSAELPSRPEHDQQAQGPDLASHGIDGVDLHPSWLKKWRSLRTEPGGIRMSDRSDESVGDLQNRIAQTPAHTLAGLPAQAELISELAWNDVVAATARRLVAGLKRLQRPDIG